MRSRTQMLQQRHIHACPETERKSNGEMLCFASQLGSMLDSETEHRTYSCPEKTMEKMKIDNHRLISAEIWTSVLGGAIPVLIPPRAIIVQLGRALSA
jgi:hypothetical protein